jgi:hypothetical protein
MSDGTGMAEALLGLDGFRVLDSARDVARERRDRTTGYSFLRARHNAQVMGGLVYEFAISRSTSAWQ